MSIPKNKKEKAAWTNLSVKEKLGRKVNLHKFDLEKQIIVLMGDEHIGSKFYNEYEHLKNVEWCYNNNIPIILMGDEMETATKTSIGAGVFEQDDIVQEQLEKVVRIYKPLAKEGLILGNHIGNHECFSDDTKILTQNGWLTHNEIKDDDLVLSFNMKNECGEWINIDKIHKYYYEGEMFNLKSSRLDFLFTPNHRLLFKNKKNWRLKTLETFKNVQTKITIPISVKNNKKDYNVKDDELRIMAWFLTDGWIQNNKYCYFIQSEPKQKLIIDILHALKWEYTIKKGFPKIKEICGKKLKKTPKPNYTIYLRRQFSDKLLTLLNYKKKIPKFVENLSERQIDVFINSFIDGDGSRKKECKTSTMIYSSYKDEVDLLQKILVQNGYSCHYDEYRKDTYRLNITKRTTTELCGNGKFIDKHITTVPYKGIIWCLSVPNENFMIRRNGKICFTGNSRVYNSSGANLSKILSQILDIQYLGVGAAHIIRVGNQSYTLYTAHGASGARLPHTKIANTIKMNQMIDAEIYAQGHLHQLSHHVQNFYKIDKSTRQIKEAQRHYILTGSYLDHWGSYAHTANMEPARNGSPKLKLSGIEHIIRVSL